MISTHFEQPHQPTERDLRLMDLLARQAADYLERKQAEEALRGQQAQLETELADTRLLHETSAALVREHNENAIYEKLMDAAAAIMRSDMACFQALDEQKDALRLLAWRGFDRAFGDLFMWCRPDSLTCCSLARRIGQRVIVPDIEKWDFIANTPAVQEFRKLGVAALQSTPLIARSGKLVGMITTHWRQAHEPTGRDLRLLDILARQAADLLERRQAESALRESEARLQTELADSKLLQSISAEIVSESNLEALYEKLVDAAGTIMRSDFASMQMYCPERGSGELRLLALRGFAPEAASTWAWVSRNSPSSCGEALRRGERVVGADVNQCEFLGAEGLAAYRAAGIASMQSTPLFSRNGDLVGMLSTHWRVPHHPADRELRLLDILARLAADVIERRRAEILLHESKALLQGQKDAFHSAMKGSSLEDSLNVLVRLAVQFTGGRARAAFFLMCPDGKTLRHVVGMTREYAFDVDGFVIGGDSLACGLAMHLRQPVITPDVEKEPRWEPWRWMARRHDYRACWSFPVHTKDGPVFGTFAMYFREPNEPSPAEMEWATVIAHAATVIISRHQQSAEREQAELSLRETNERLKKVLEIETVGVIFWDLTTGCLVDANDTFLKMMGYSRAEVASHSLTWEKFTPPEYHEISRAEIARFNATGRVGPYEKEYFHKDGSRRWLLFAGSSLDNDQCVEFCVDIAERKKIEQALRDSEDRFRTLADNISQLAWMTDKDGWIFWYNRRWFDYTGTTLEEMQGWGWESVHHPEHISRVKALWQDHLHRGATWEDTFPLRGADGNFRWFLSRAVPIRDAQGNIVRWFGTNTDVTELRQAQAQLADRAGQLEHLVSERTTSLTQAIAQMEDFTYSVSHDLRAPARTVRGIAQAAIEDYGGTMPDELRGLLDRISVSGQRMELLIRDILNYSRVSRSEVKLAPVQLDQLIPAIISERPETQPQRAEINIRAPLGPVLAHEPSLCQAITNLLANAVKFVPRGATPKVQLWTERNNGSVRLWVTDNGIGVSPKYQHRLFNVFERAHVSPQYEGTGIGLAIVRKAAEKMGGKVGVVSDGVSGSSFWIELPAASL